ncbi:hypothetical protein KC338_g3669 [Hortaea werneckii]|nr:hypothetical protein KC338_g3669 [Hortaea werneckii]
MKTCLLTTPLVLFALGVKTISALPATSDAAVLAAGVGPAAIAEKMVTSSSTPAALEMEKRTFNPLRGCNPTLDKCQKRCDRDNPRKLDKEYHENRRERNSCKDQCYYLLSGEGNWQEMGMGDAHEQALKDAEEEKEDEKIEGGKS